MEKGITCKDDPIVAVYHIPADAVLCVAGRVEPLHGDVAKAKSLTVARRLRDGFAVLSSDDLEPRDSELGYLD